MFLFHHTICFYNLDQIFHKHAIDVYRDMLINIAS